MKSTELVKNKGLNYAKNIVRDSPEETKEKYFVSISEIKDVLKSHELIDTYFETVEMAEYEYMVSGDYSDPYWVRLKQAIADVEDCQ